MKVTKNLLTTQYSEYHQRHTTRLNLFIHILTVPVFCAGLLTLIFGAINLDAIRSMLGAGAMLFVVAAQGFGHAKEPGEKATFLSPLDFLVRFIVENTVTFWRFLFAGGWKKAWRQL